MTMHPLDTVDPDVLLAGRSDWFDAEVVETLSHHPLDGIDTEFPHYVREVESPDGPERPRETHPVFFGCYDWHSAVHSHWALVRQLRLVDDHPNEETITERFDERLTSENVAGEVSYFESNESFEKPYGWAWLLHLAAELALWEDDRAKRWRQTLAPLEETIRDLLEREFLTQDRPHRVGTHGNSAFALHCTLDYARTVDDSDLTAQVTETALAWYADDTDYPLEYEPLGWDFLSPALTEADLMRRIYDTDAFERWFDDFLPGLGTSRSGMLLAPVGIDDDTDEGLVYHFAGLNLARAWAMAGVADALDGHPGCDVLEAGARRHLETGLEQAFTDEYAGSHWLSSYVIYALTRNEDGIAPEPLDG